MEIDNITLRGVLPEVFAGEAPTGGDIWLRDITFTPGNYYMVEAESGTGKSSLCSFIYGNRSDYQGTICFGSRDIRTLSIAEWCDVRRSGIALLPQEMRIFPELTAMENVLIKNNLASGLPVSEITSMFSRLGIAEKADTPAGKLSIGQQQRVAIIRTLCQDARFIILDEPVSHLDRRNNLIVSAMVLERARHTGAAIISTSVGNPLLLPADTIHLTL